MKQYNNGPRKGMMYGGMPQRKPMLYGGVAKKKPRKKAYGGGMMSASQPQQNMMQNNTMTARDMNQMQTQMMQTPKLRMANGGSAFGMLSVKAGIDKNPKPTQADRIAGAKMKKKR